MASEVDNPIWKQAKEIIFTIFDEATTSQWLKLEQRYLIPTPSRASGGDFIESHCCDVQAKLQEGFAHIFEHSHVNTFWEDLVFKLKQATSIHPVVSRKRQNEEHLVTSLIYPTLRKVVESISIIPEKHTDEPHTKCAVSSHLVIQDEIKIGNASPTVDASIQISDGKTCKVFVPVEAKVEIKPNHVYQIAAYVTKVSTAEDLEKKVVIGILIDKENFQLVFSPYFFFDKSGDVPKPLPIVYVSPLIMWKNSAPQTLFSIIPAALLVIACTCYFQLDRIECDQKNIDSNVVNVARKLLLSRHEFKPIFDDVRSAIDDLLHVSKRQKEEIEGLKKKVDQLEEKVHLKENGAITDSQKQ